MISKTTWTRIKRDERGASFMEYVILVGLIAVVCFAVYQNFGSAISTTVAGFTETVNQVASAGKPAPPAP